MQFGGGEKIFDRQKFDGRLWARVPPKILKKKFRFLDHRTLQRYISALEKMGAPDYITRIDSYKRTGIR